MSYEEESFGAALDPLLAVARLARAGDFGDHLAYETAGRWVFAAGELASVSLDAEHVRIRFDGAESVTPWSGSPGAALHRALDSLPITGWNAYGRVEFGFAGVVPALAALGAESPRGELARLMIPRLEVRLDTAGAVIRGAGAVPARVRELLAQPENRECAATPIDIRTGGADYRERVAQAVKEIHKGEYQKVILSRTVPIPYPPDLVSTYVLGRRGNTPARSFLLRQGGLEAAGFSPEVVVTVGADRKVTTQPLAGTRAFGRGPEADAAARSELESDPKEIFEHAVSVRTAQDELRRVCRPGSVGVGDFMGISERGSVQHLASLVSGTLDEGRTAWDALEALFPAVTASGIPKRESLDAIFRLDEPRGLYSGAVVAASHDGSLDAALVLRAVYARDGRGWLRAGAGIVAESTPDREYEETCEKLSSVAPFVVQAD
ncbi:salicylate synthase [Amycolatopsis anabasis]|uniref:salicylate synthase n=1 Tax=Amycolatopsis anabasis TaxID=1840409 RepID=UPI002483B716|nr:salicylate synthase [Amycolatopsis anabasis]